MLLPLRATRFAWILLVLAIPQVSLAQATNPAQTQTQGSPASNDEDDTSNVSLAEELARVTKEFEQFESKLSLLRSLRGTVQSIKDTASRNDAAGYISFIRSTFVGLRSQIEGRESKSQASPNPRMPIPTGPGPESSPARDPEPGPPPAKPPTPPPTSGTPATRDAPRPPPDAPKDNEQSDSETRALVATIRVIVEKMAQSRQQPGEPQSPSSEPPDPRSIPSPATYLEGASVRQLRYSLAFLIQMRESTVQALTNQISGLDNTISTFGSAYSQLAFALVPAVGPPPPPAYSPALVPSGYAAGGGEDSRVAAYFPRTAFIMNQVERAERIDSNDLREAAAEMDNIEAILQRINGVDLSTRVRDLSESLEKAVSDLEASRKNKREEMLKLSRLLKSRDGLITQTKINFQLVNAVYGMIAAIVLLFAVLCFLPSPLASMVVEQRVLIEVLSMGFLLLTVIILGTGKLLNPEGLAALLGTIAGYLFARKAAEMATAGRGDKTVVVDATPSGGGGGGGMPPNSSNAPPGSSPSPVGRPAPTSAASASPRVITVAPTQPGDQAVGPASPAGETSPAPEREPAAPPPPASVREATAPATEPSGSESPSTPSAPEATSPPATQKPSHKNRGGGAK